MIGGLILSTLVRGFAGTGKSYELRTFPNLKLDQTKNTKLKFFRPLKWTIPFRELQFTDCGVQLNKVIKMDYQIQDY